MNKKKIIIYAFICLISLFSKAYSEDKCGNFFKELKNNYKVYKPDTSPSWIYEDFGFDLAVYWNNENREWDFETSKDGYFKVGKITDTNLLSKLKTGDEIISIKYKSNLIDLRDLGLDNDKVFFEDAYDIGDILNIVFKREQTFNLELKKREYEVEEPFMDIYILSMDIDDKSNKFYVRLQVDSQHSYSEEDKIYDLAMKHLYVGKKNEVDDEDYTFGCTYDVEDWSDENFALPIDGYFNNVHSINYNTFEDYVFIKPYSPTLVKEHEELGWVDTLIINYNYTGNYEFNNKYDLRNFPFDKQELKIHYVAGQSLDEELLALSDYSQNMLIDFKNKQSITGWNIKNVSLKYIPDQDPIDLTYSDGVSINVEIERKYGYYLYKVILPIVLILMICWSSLWIPHYELESKLTITIVCLLSLIAYNFVIDKDLPKLEYLTILDWVILVSYFYATIPNFLSVYFFRLYKQRNKTKLRVYELYFRKYGAFSYLTIIFLIILFNVQINPAGASSIISWMKI